MTTIDKEKKQKCFETFSLNYAINLIKTFSFSAICQHDDEPRAEKKLDYLQGLSCVIVDANFLTLGIWIKREKVIQKL